LAKNQLTTSQTLDRTKSNQSSKQAQLNKLKHDPITTPKTTKSLTTKATQT